MGGNDATVLLGFSMHGSSGNCFLHSTEWSEKQRTERGERIHEKKGEKIMKQTEIRFEYLANALFTHI